MAKDKKSFIAYCDWIDTFEILPDEKAGQLIKHILRYVNDKSPKSDDVLINAVFANIKTTLKRDLQKYSNYIEKQRVNGSKGGRPKSEDKNPKKGLGFLANPDKPKKADSVSVSDSVNDNKEKDIYIESGHLFITWEDFNKLSDEFGIEKSDEYIRKVLNYRKNSSYKSLYLTALNWLKKDKKEFEEKQLKQKPKLAI